MRHIIHKCWKEHLRWPRAGEEEGAGAGAGGAGQGELAKREQFVISLLDVAEIFKIN